MNSLCALAGAALAGLILAPAIGSAGSGETTALEIATEARALQPGELILVTASIAERASAVRIQLFNKVTRAFPNGDKWEGLVGIDLDQKPGTYSLTIDARVGGKTVTAARQLTIQAKAFPTRTLRVAPDFVNPPPAVQERIAGDTALINAVYANSAPERLWTDPFVRPVPQPSNSAFGTRSVFNGEARSPHAGTDFLSGAGTPVMAPNAGRVVVARDIYFSGNTVIIDHGLGMFSMLAHLSRIDVREGETIPVGRTVGLVGATGRVTGPHLHWALRVNGARVDALSALQLLGTRPGVQ